MRDSLTLLLEIAGLGLLVVAAFMLATVAGLAAAGLASLLLAWGLSR